MTSRRLEPEQTWDEAATELELPATLVMIGVRAVGERVQEVEFTAESGASLPAWTPGSHVDLSLPVGIRRSYSLLPPLRPATWRIAVLEEAESRGASRWLHHDARPGDRVVAEAVRNNFELQAAPGGVVFVAGGIGLTPLLSMVAELASRNAPWWLHVAVADRAHLGLLGEFRGRPEVYEYGRPPGWRIDLAALTSALAADQLLYVCGPERMLREVKELLPGDPRVRVEAFGAAVVDQDTDATIRVECARTGMTVDVPTGCSILKAVHDAGVDVPSSCEEGVCGSCETAVLAGVPDHRDAILSDEERAAGDTMMICVGRALTPHLVLDL